MKQYLWNFLAYFAGAVLPPLLIIFLARILTPADFGVYALYAAAIGVVQSLVFAPLGEIVLKSENDSIIDYLFSFQIILIVFLGAILYILSLFHLSFLPELSLIGLFLINSVLISFVDISLKHSMRDINFKYVFVRRIISPLGNALSSVPLALFGFGYWSLILGQTGGYLATSFFILSYATYPKLNWRLRFLINEFSFGGQMFLQGLVRWVRSKADRVVLGIYRSTEETGKYDLIRLMSSLPFTSIVEPVAQVLYSKTLRIRGNDELVASYQNAQRRILYFSMPLFVFLEMNSFKVLELLLGGPYLELNSIFQLFLIIGLLSTIVGSNVEYFKAVSKPAIMTKFMLIRGVCTSLILLIMAPKGLLILSKSLLILALIFSPINVFLTQGHMGKGLKHYLKEVIMKPLSFTVLYFILCWLMSFLPFSDLLFLILSLLLLIAFVVASFIFFERTLVKNILNKYK